jgi:hypothetical protein
METNAPINGLGARNIACMARPPCVGNILDYSPSFDVRIWENSMRSVRAVAKALGAVTVLASISASPVAAQSSALPQTVATPESKVLTQKLNAYVECINRLSERSYQSRSRYFSWAAKSGPTGKERIIYGTYTIYETAPCKQKVEAANALEPHEPELEAAAEAYAAAVVTLEPLLKEADDYYDQQNYKDDKMAKGRALHPRLVAAWNAFEAADVKLRKLVDEHQDRQARARLAEIERTEGIKDRYHIEAVMLTAKYLIRAQQASPFNLEAFTKALSEFEAIVKATEDYAEANKGSKVGSSFIRDAKSYLTTAKMLMRRVRDKVPYSQGDRMLMESGGGAWMVEGSPARLARDYNQLISSYNRGGRF